MTLFDACLQVFLAVNGFASSPFVLIVLAFIGAYLGVKAVERIPFTRRIIERRETQFAEHE